MRKMMGFHALALVLAALLVHGKSLSQPVVGATGWTVAVDRVLGTWNSPSALRHHRR
jgi:hypothetical protein